MMEIPEIMKRLVFFSILLAIIPSSSTLFAESVSFVGLSSTVGIDPLILKANLVKLPFVDKQKIGLTG
jgi:hypothetical protein